MTKKSKKPPGKSGPTRAAARKSPAKPKAPAPGKLAAKRKPATAAAVRDPLDDFIDAAASVLALPVEPSWRAAIKANLDATLRLGTLVATFELPDEAEPAPVFGA